MHYDYGHLVGYHGMSYIKSNLPKVAIWRSNGFRISPHIAKKSTTLLFSGTFGHTVEMKKLCIHRESKILVHFCEAC